MGLKTGAVINPEHLCCKDWPIIAYSGALPQWYNCRTVRQFLRVRICCEHFMDPNTECQVWTTGRGLTLLTGNAGH